MLLRKRVSLVTAIVVMRFTITPIGESGAPLAVNCMERGRAKRKNN
jgi:hypothetical protein